MTQPLYLQPAEVAPIPGRFQTLWRAMADPSHPDEFSGAQLQLVEEASATIDDLTGQAGGLLTQTAKTERVTVRESTDTIWLPNKPLSEVTAISVRRGAQTFTYDVAGVDYDGKSQFFIYQPWNQSGQIPSGLAAMTFGLDGIYFPFGEGDRVDVTYSCGYAADALPSPVREVCRRILAEAIVSQAENPIGANEAREGSTHYRFGTQGAINTVDIRTRRALLPYCVNKVR